MNDALRQFSARAGALARHPLLQRLTVYGFSASAAQFMMMIYAILVARSLGPEKYGLFAGNYALAGLTIFLVNWGMDTWMLREGGRHPDPRALSSTVLQTKLMMGVLWALLLVTAAPLIRPGLFPRTLLLICALDVLSDSVLVTLISGFNIQKQTGQASQLLLLTRGVRLAGAVLLILTGAQQPLIYAGLRFLATLTGLCWGWILARPLWSRNGLTHSVSTLKASLAYGVTELLALIYAQADVTLLGFLAGKVAVGEYSPALSLVNSLSIVPNSVFYILVPILSNTFVTNNERFKKSSQQMVGIYGIVGLVMAVGVAFIFKPVIMILLGEKFLQTGNLVLIMSPILLFKAISYASATYLVVVGWQSKRIGAQLASALANIGLNLIFIPMYGPLGAASVYLFSEAVLMVGYSFTALYHYRQFTKGTMFERLRQ